MTVPLDYKSIKYQLNSRNNNNVNKEWIKYRYKDTYIHLQSHVSIKDLHPAITKKRFKWRRVNQFHLIVRKVPNDAARQKNETLACPWAKKNNSKRNH